MPKGKSTAIIKPNLGLYLDRPSIALDQGALQDGLNFRIKLGELNNLNLGWSAWNSVVLNGPVAFIQQFTTSAGINSLILASPTDLYMFNVGAGRVFYISPIYNTGTASASGTAVTGSGTLWNTTVAGDTWKNAKAGDQISFGSSSQNDPTATWFTIQTVNSDTSLTLTASAGSVGSGNYTLRRRFTGGVFTDPWQTETFVNAPGPVDLIFMTNGVDNIVSWDGVQAQVTKQIGFGFTAQTIVQYGDMMLYGNVVQGSSYLGTTFLNSDIGKPANVGSASTGVAGQFIVQGQPDPILAMKRLGPYLIFYCQHNIIMGSLTGNSLIFAFRIAAANKGIVGHNAISTFPTIHQFIAPDSMYQFDGSNTQPVNTHIWRNLLSSVDYVRLPNIFTILDEQNGEQIWSVPQTTDPGAGVNTNPGAFAWTEHYLEETAGQAQSALIASAMGINRPYSKRSFAFTCVGTWLNQTVTTWNQLTQTWASYNYRWSDSFFSANFPILLVGDANGKVYHLNGGQNGNGTNLSSFVTFGRRAMIDGRMRGMLRRIYPFVNTFISTLSITCGFSDFASAAPQRSATFTYSEQQTNTDTFFVPVYRRGRYVDITFGDTTANTWTLNGFDVDIFPGGMR